MNILILVLLIIAGIIALVLILALFTRKEYGIEREITIGKPDKEVFNYVRYLKNQDHFNTWVMVDPAMKKSYKGTDGAAGFAYAWDGNKKAGAGEQEIKKIQQDKRLDIEIRFVRPFAGVAHTSIILDSPSASQTKVKWTMNSQMKYPMNAMLLFMNMDTLLGKDLEASLRNLKGILEK